LTAVWILLPAEMLTELGGQVIVACGPTSTRGPVLEQPGCWDVIDPQHALYATGIPVGFDVGVAVAVGVDVGVGVGVGVAVGPPVGVAVATGVGSAGSVAPL